jgi:hypothetical protein
MRFAISDGLQRVRWGRLPVILVVLDSGHECLDDRCRLVVSHVDEHLLLG